MPEVVINSGPSSVVTVTDNNIDLTINPTANIDLNFDVAQGPAGPVGMGLNILDVFTSTSQLPLTGNSLGDAYIVAGALYVWTGNGYEQPATIEGPTGTVAANQKTPSSSSATGTTGEFCWDSNYLYMCVSTNTWKRVLLSSW